VKILDKLDPRRRELINELARARRNYDDLLNAYFAEIENSQLLLARIAVLELEVTLPDSLRKVGTV
jgi:hypothetical protein